MEETIFKVKSLVQDGRLDEAIVELSIIKVPSYLSNRISLQCARYRIFKNHEINDDLSFEQLEIEQHKIINSILCIIDSINKTEEIEEERKSVNYEKNQGNVKISLLENTTFVGVVFAVIGLLLILTSHIGHEKLVEAKFWSGVTLLFISLATFIFTRGFIAPKVISSYQKAEVLSKDFQLLFIDLSMLLRHSHDFSTFHIRNIETTIDILKNKKQVYNDEELGLIERLKNYSTMAGIFDDTMNILEDIEVSIIQSNNVDVSKYNVGLEKNTLRIKELKQKVKF